MAKEKCIAIETSVFVRLDKAHLFASDQESGKYSARIVIPKSDQKTISALQDGCDEIMAAYPFKNCNSKNPPKIVDRHGNSIEDPEEVYNGMYVRAYFTLQPYDYKREGIRCELTVI